MSRAITEVVPMWYISDNPDAPLFALVHVRYGH